MYQFFEKIILIAKTYGNKVLAISYRLSAIFITLAKKSHLIAKTYGNKVLAISYRLSAIFITLAKKSHLIAKTYGNKVLAISYRLSAIFITLAKKSHLIAKTYGNKVLAISYRLSAIFITLAKKSHLIAKTYGNKVLAISYRLSAIFITLAKKSHLIAKTYGNKVLAISYRLSAIFITLAKKSHLKLEQYFSAIKKNIKSKWSFVRNRIIQYHYLIRLDKPAGILLLLWPVLWALWIAAEGHPDLDILFIFILGVVVMRSAGCVLNDLADRNLDRHVLRTRDRPVTSGKVKPLEAMGIAIALLICAVILVLNLNGLTFKLSFVAVFLAIIYPFMKRVTYLPQVFLGLAFAWSIPMAFAAQTNSIPDIAWLLFIITILWVVVYDTMYAMVDKADDIKIGVKSTAILFDDADRAIIGSIQLMILFSQILTGTRLELGKYYFIGIAFASLLSVYQQYLIKDRIAENCFRAFLNNQWYGMIVFAGLYLNYMFR